MASQTLIVDYEVITADETAAEAVVTVVTPATSAAFVAAMKTAVNDAIADDPTLSGNGYTVWVWGT